MNATDVCEYIHCYHVLVYAGTYILFRLGVPQARRLMAHQF